MPTPIPAPDRVKMAIFGRFLMPSNVAYCSTDRSVIILPPSTARGGAMASEKTLQKSQTPRAKRRERRDTRPQEIVDAAFEEFATHGYAATKVEDVATPARGSKGLPVLLFKTKEELFKAVVRSVITTHFDAMRERMEKTELSVEAFLKGPFLSFIQELVGYKRAFIARLLIAEGHKYPELTAFYYEQVVSRGVV